MLLTAGRIAVAVSKAQMKPGETVEIKTPNVVVAIRGTFVVAEVSAGRSTFTILRGLVEVTKLDPATGKPVGPAVKVGALERVIVTDAGPVPALQAITPEASKSLASDFTFLPTAPPVASVPALNQAAKEALHTVNSVASPPIGALTGATGVTGTAGDSIAAPAVGAPTGATGVTGTAGIGAAAAGPTTPTGGSLPISPTGTTVGGVLSPLIPPATQPVTNGLLPGQQRRP